MLLAIASAALFALVAPAAANAQLLTSEGEAVPVGHDLTATSTDLKIATETGISECEKVTLHLEVTANEASTSAGTSTSVTTEDCVTNVIFAKIPTTITNASVALHLEEGGVGAAQMTYIDDIEAPEGTKTCHYAGEPGLGYETETDVISLEGLVAGSGEGCPRSGEMKGSFTLETENGNPVTID